MRPKQFPSPSLEYCHDFQPNMFVSGVLHPKYGSILDSVTKASRAGQQQLEGRMLSSPMAKIEATVHQDSQTFSRCRFMRFHARFLEAESPGSVAHRPGNEASAAGAYQRGSWPCDQTLRWSCETVISVDHQTDCTGVSQQG